MLRHLPAIIYGIIILVAGALIGVDCLRKDPAALKQSTPQAKSLRDPWPPKSTPEAIASAARKSIPSNIRRTLEKRTGKTVVPLMVRRWHPDEKMNGAYLSQMEKEAGLSVQKIRSELAKEVFSDHHEDFKSQGYILFLTNTDFVFKKNKATITIYDVAVVKADTHYDVVRLIHTDAPNYDLDNTTIINQLKKWENTYPFNIIVVDSDSIEARFISLPKNAGQLASEIYSFCPDVVDQGVGSVSALRGVIENEGVLYLWWD